MGEWLRVDLLLGCEMASIASHDMHYGWHLFWIASSKVLHDGFAEHSDQAASDLIELCPTGDAKPSASAPMHKTCEQIHPLRLMRRKPLWY